MHGEMMEDTVMESNAEVMLALFISVASKSWEAVNNMKQKQQLSNVGKHFGICSKQQQQSGDQCISQLSYFQLFSCL